MADIANNVNNTLISGTADDDYINNSYDEHVTIIAYAGNDFIGNYSGSNVTIDGGEGNDNILNTGYYDSDGNWYGSDNASIDGGVGDDFINNSGSNVTINGGDGNDSIQNIAADYTYTSDDGTTVHYSGDSVTIDGGVGDDFINNFGSNVTINGGDGNDSIQNLAEDYTITNADGTTGTVHSNGNTVTIDSGAGDDDIHNYGSNVSIFGGDGNDSIYNFAGDYTYTFDDGSTSTHNYNGNMVTINGGVGDDTIYLDSVGSGIAIQYNFGDGNDTVYGYSSANVALDISTEWSSVISGSDTLITAGDGSILLVGSADTTAGTETTVPADSMTSDTTPADTTPADTTPADTIPVDTTPADTTPADTTPADTTPADTTPADTTPADTTPADTTPADTTATNAITSTDNTDVIFLIDKSGSMDDEIQRVKDAIVSFANSLGTSGSNFRFAIVEFGQDDNGGKPVVKTFTSTSGVTPYFTANIEEFTDSLDTNAYGWAEYGLSAIQMALNIFQNDPREAQKRIVVLTDAGYEGDSGEAVGDVTAAEIASSLAAAGVKMDVVGKTNSECQYEYEPLAVGTGGKFYDISTLSYYEYFEEIADDISGIIHINVDLSTVPDATSSGHFFVNVITDETGNTVLASNVATFKTAPEEGDFAVGEVVAGNYTADPESLWRQIISVPENWIVGGTYNNDAINVTGNNVTVSGSLGNDNISINNGVVNVTVVDVAELQNGNDKLSFSTHITPGELRQTATEAGVVLNTDDNSVSFTLYGISSLDDSLLNCEVSNAGTPNTIRELLYGETDITIVNPDNLSGIIQFAHWGFGFTPPDNSPLFGFGNSADLAENFVSSAPE